MSETVALVTVAVGDTYEAYADEMLRTANVWFLPSDNVRFVKLRGRDGAWPAGTMYRHHVLAATIPILKADYVFLIDADARFEAKVGPEILSFPDGITATYHPGYVGQHRTRLPYERRPESCCCVDEADGGTYFCGGFVGGTSDAMLGLSREIARLIDLDAANGVTPTWHDESALNRALLTQPPALVLSPAYAHPDDDAYYVEHVWQEPYERLIVMLDKTAAERGDR